MPVVTGPYFYVDYYYYKCNKFHLRSLCLGSSQPPNPLTLSGCRGDEGPDSALARPC